MAVVEKHPFPLDQMLFMDWRDGHLDDKLKAQNDTLPTFLYAMPFAEDRIFLEETSLVALPPVTSAPLPFDQSSNPAASG